MEEFVHLGAHYRSFYLVVESLFGRIGWKQQGHYLQEKKECTLLSLHRGLFLFVSSFLVVTFAIWMSSEDTMKPRVSSTVIVTFPQILDFSN